MSAAARPAICRTNPWAALSALCIGFFLIMMDITIVNVAIPDMLIDLSAGLHEIVWVNSTYLLAYAVPLLFAGRLGDRLGRKPVFLAGMVVFTSASLFCGLANSATELIAARTVQGLGAALMAPQTMAFIGTLFPENRRGAALGAWGAVAGLASIVGPLAGGFLVAAGGWQWIFLINLPIGLLGVVLTVLLVPGGQPRRQRRFDLVGTLLSALGLFSLVFGLQNGDRYGWGRVFGPVTITGLIVVGVLLLAVFAWWQRAGSNDPLMPLTVFRRRNFSGASIAAVSIAFALTGMYLPLSLFLQSVLGMSARDTGLTLVAMAVSGIVAGPIAGVLSDRISGRWVVLTSFLLFATGIGILAAASRPGVSLSWVVLGLFVAGLGTGGGFSAMANVAMSGMPGPLMGVASGTYNTVRQVGSVLGSAAVGVLLQAQLTGTAEPAGVFGAGDGLPPQDLADAAAAAFYLLLAVLLVGAVACLLMTARPAEPPGSPAQTAEEPVPAEG
ncbi:DHA2 family efflux MFS transporter permease subunit [Solwaraspora sp. WMMD791]|uniref:DHA2 family efflux MFS transporter permease subunit n=1 Tax=Solwaraspora sp. WMMD791 TaxID=3016086 RepID=UPI002499F7E5|nr:DHA2 family efflux MFS transporter permease subunit [Solwaraspora sp. WMMD791]WFE26124.1 DHA2 family efflux MFS transporter permease subunit [Solwaraspora sp. WMMD791]